MAEKKRKRRAARTYCIRGDAFCVAVADLADRMLAEVIYMRGQRGFNALPPIHRYSQLHAAVIKMIRDLKTSATRNKKTVRTYARELNRVKIVQTFFWHACDDWVEQLALPQKPDKRQRPGQQASRRF